MPSSNLIEAGRQDVDLGFQQLITSNQEQTPDHHCQQIKSMDSLLRMLDVRELTLWPRNQQLPTMPVKRRAQEPLELAAGANSPASKRARVEDELLINGESKSNGHRMPLRPQDRDRIDLLGADEVLHEELEEAAATP